MGDVRQRPAHAPLIVTPAKKKSARQVREPAPEYSGTPALWRAADSPTRDTLLLMDTHVWLWTLDDTRGALSNAATQLIASAAAAGRLFASDISFWEVAMLVAKGRLELAADPFLWLQRAAQAPGIQLLPLSREVLVASTSLAGTLHGDPADRMLLAQAQRYGCALLTCDKALVAYAERQPGVPVCDAR